MHIYLKYIELIDTNTVAQAKNMDFYVLQSLNNNRNHIIIKSENDREFTQPKVHEIVERHRRLKIDIDMGRVHFAEVLQKTKRRYTSMQTYYEMSQWVRYQSVCDEIGLDKHGFFICQ